MFQQTDVPSHERGRRKSEDLPERKIPRHDSEDRAERLVVNIAAGRVRLCRLVFKEPLCIIGIKPTAARTFLNLFQGRTEQLSHFECDDFGEPVLFQQQQLSRGRHEFGALAKGSSPIFPGRVLGALQAFLDFGIVERRKFLQLFAGRRIDRSNWHISTLHRL